MTNIHKTKWKTAADPQQVPDSYQRNGTLMADARLRLDSDAMLLLMISFLRGVVRRVLGSLPSNSSC